jgi:hypothetical protein
MMPKLNQYEEDDENLNMENEEETEDDDRPWPITKETLREIKNMSPLELQALLENLDLHEEWESLRETARDRVGQWLGAIKKAEAAPRCQFVKLNGNNCGSPAMKGQSLCYYHAEAEKRKAEEADKALTLPTLEDKVSVQLAILRVFNHLVEKSIDEKTGRALISALRLAQRNIGDGTSVL